MRRLILVISIVLSFWNGTAEARQHHHYKHHTYHRHHSHRVHIAKVNPVEQACIFICSTMQAYQKYQPAHVFTPTRYTDSGTVVAHPAGCPSRAFCGCGSSIRAFGHSVRELWLAANWYKFPRAAPGPGMAEVRPHHVRIIEADLGNGLYQFYDPNSGRGQTRIHADRIKGTIVNPHGAG